MSNISWENYVFNENKFANIITINQIAKQWQVVFPEDYINCVSENQGKSPEPSIFKIGKEGEESVFNVLYHFEENEPSYYIGNVNKESLANNIYPFAEDPAGNYICFDYRNSDKNPKIVFANTEIEGEEAITFLADSFTEFMNSIF